MTHQHDKKNRGIFFQTSKKISYLWCLGQYVGQ